MISPRPIFLLVVVCLGQIPGCVQATLATGLPQTADCRALIQSLLGGMGPSSDVQEMSEQAQGYLKLIDVGLSHLGIEVPALLKNLRGIVDSSLPMNPFLNLESSLARALAEKVEPTLVVSNGDWAVIRQRILARLGAGSSRESQRQQDRQATRLVLGFSEVSLGKEATASNSFVYVGQTDRYYVFNNTSVSEQRGLYRLSKDQFELQKIPGFASSYGPSLFQMRWMHDGRVYGYGRKDPMKSSSLIRIFQLNPETLEVAWSEPWTDQARLSYRFFWVRTSNLVVGIPNATKGSILKFDYDLLRFVPSGLEFDLDQFQKVGNPNAVWDGRSDVGSSVPDGSPVLIERRFKTDGRILVPAGETNDWQHWSVEEGVQWGQFNSADQEILFFDRYLQHSHSVYKVRDREPIRFSLPMDFTSGKSVSLESVDQGAAILVSILSAPSSEGKTILMIAIDRGSWTAREIQVIGGPSVPMKGQWRVIRNQADEILLEFNSAMDPLKPYVPPETALWSFNSARGAFDLAIHEVFVGDSLKGTGHAYGPIVDHGYGPIFDYDRKTLIGWRVKFGLNILREFDVERSGSEGAR